MLVKKYDQSKSCKQGTLQKYNMYFEMDEVYIR